MYAAIPDGNTQQTLPGRLMKESPPDVHHLADCLHLLLQKSQHYLYCDFTAL